MANLAVFDLDYTLTRQGTWGRFVSAAVRGRPLALPALWTVAGLTQLAYKRGRVPRIAVKTAMLRRSFSGWPRDRIEALADRFVARDEQDGMNARVLHALGEHQARGDTVLIASAAVDVLVSRYADALAVDGQVSTALAWDGDRVGDGFASANCYGAEKLVRVQAWLAERGLSPSRVTAYSDSRSDAPLLEWADRAVVVRPRAKTRRYAASQGFEVWT